MGKCPKKCPNCKHKLKKEGQIKICPNCGWQCSWDIPVYGS